MKKLQIIDFYADWCAPCKMMEQILNKVNSRFENVRLNKIDVDKFKEIAEAYKVKSLPTIIIEDDDGNVYNKFVGVISEKDINDAIRQINKEVE